MEIMFVDAKYTGKVRLDKTAISECKKFSKVGVYASVQFASKVDSVLAQLGKEGVKAVTSKPARTSVKGQILGCDIYPGNLHLKDKVDVFLYIGDGQFHPTALSMSGAKPVIVFNPISGKTSVIEQKDVEKIRKRQKGALVKFLSSNKIGVLVSLKHGQEHMDEAIGLEKKFPDKKFYYFVSDELRLSEMDNFPFVEAWINTACPRIVEDSEKAVLNVSELNKL